MLYRLHTGWNVAHVSQVNVMYLVSTTKAVQGANLPFVFTDGHGLAAITEWFDDLTQLMLVDWSAVNLNFWNDTPDAMDCQRRKQAEFLIHRSLPWELIEKIAVFSHAAKVHVESMLAWYPTSHRPSVAVEPSWYY